MVGNIITVIYLVGGLFSWWRITGQLAWNMKYSGDPVPEGTDYVFAALFGGMLALIWPISLIISIAMSYGIHNGVPKLMYTPQREKIKLQQRRIEELEREVGIK